MDLKALIAKATAAQPVSTASAVEPIKVIPVLNANGQTASQERTAEEAKQIVQPVNDSCIIHDTTPIQSIDLKSQAIPDLDIYNGLPADTRDFAVYQPLTDHDDDPGEVPEYDAKDFGTKEQFIEKWSITEAALPLVIPAAESITSTAPCESIRPVTGKTADDPLAVEPGNCTHCCSECSRLWTHGPKEKCRFPDMFNQGPCQNCLNGEESTFGEDYELDERGQIKLFPARITQVRNATRRTCAEMTIEQLTAHIQYNAKRIAELQADSMESRKMRAEREEQALLEIPESEREAFRQALRRGGTKTPKAKKEPKEKKESPKVREAALIVELAKDMPLATAKLVAGMMVKTGKTREQVEAWIND